MAREALLWVFLGSTLLPFSSVVIPLFIIVQRLGQLDSLGGLTLPFLVTGQAIFLSRQFIRGIPDDYLEAARIDGASETWVFLHIVLPLSGSAISTVAVISFLASWNQFLWPLVDQLLAVKLHCTAGLVPARRWLFVPNRLPDLDGVGDAGDDPATRVLPDPLKRPYLRGSSK